MIIIQRLRQRLDSITSYRVVLYGLLILAACAVALSATNVLTYSSVGIMAGALVTLLVVSYGTNMALGAFFKLPWNQESPLITAIILFFVLGMPTKAIGWYGLVFAAIVAVASKYVITWKSAHIFNPAAYGVMVVSLMGIGSGTWWIASTALFFPMAIVGFIMLLKIRRFEMFGVFAAASLAMIILNSNGLTFNQTLINAFTLYPLLFLGTIMLTEPSTMPTTYRSRLVFGALVGLAFGYTFDLGFIASSPHLALLLGNLFAFVVADRSSTQLTLVEKQQLTPTTFNYSFRPDKPLHHVAGQYMDFTMSDVKFDSRGNRRTFTIASAPNDELIQIGVKFYEPGSTFKTKLASLKIGDTILGSHVAGDFTLPKQLDTPVVFVAGGIGITPFIAMLQQRHVDKSKRPVTLFYFVRDKSEIAYSSQIKQARDEGVQVIIKAGQGQRLADEDIANLTKAHFYISGPPPFVNAYKQTLRSNKIANIHVDFFSGY